MQGMCCMECEMSYSSQLEDYIADKYAKSTKICHNQVAT